ncbi:MAG TPA: hypothetical protein VMS22_23465 [Candidatus Eisenbacteria bacterium]|nr:hypothetical protein [Candidatus Eisenbacteria bacterium]
MLIRIRRGYFSLLAVGLFVVTPAVGHAIVKCSAKVNSKTGVIDVYASGVSGTLLWGDRSGAEATSFFNATTCIAGASASRCELGAAGSVQAITPPDLCTVYLKDSGPECAAHMKGCTPGVRFASQEQADALRMLAAAISFHHSVPTIEFSGVNIQIDSGSGVTDASPNGAGNLIIGYNEQRCAVAGNSCATDGDCAPAACANIVGGLGHCALEATATCLSDDDCTPNTCPRRDGSHNLIIGSNHSYSSFGGLVAGDRNTVSGTNASVTGGRLNTASAPMASVSGGVCNVAGPGFPSCPRFSVDSGASAMSISGGAENIASGNVAWVGGGGFNTASGVSASVSGGTINTASWDYASVSGGYENTASRNYASVSGGYLNRASSDYASVSGGYGNQATGGSASVCGGWSNMASGAYTAVSGGYGNQATGGSASVCGGWNNTASGDYASVSGGECNQAGAGPAPCVTPLPNAGAAVSGGFSNVASGETASVSGGIANMATGRGGSVTGGYNNTANGLVASVSGGGTNAANTDFSSISGGALLTTGSTTFEWHSGHSSGYPTGTEY